MDRKTKQTIYTFRPEVEYAYTVDGREFKSTRDAFGKILWYQPAEAESFKQAFCEGAAIRVFYDPAKPGEAVIDPSTSHATKLVAADFGMLGAGLVLAGLGVAGISGVM